MTTKYFLVFKHYSKDDKMSIKFNSLDELKNNFADRVEAGYAFVEAIEVKNGLARIIQTYEK